MQTVMKKWFELNQDMMVAGQKLFDINSNLAMNLAQQQIELYGIYVDSSSKQVQSFGKAKGMQDAMSSQTELFDEFKKKFVNNLRVTVEMLVESRSQFAEWAESNVKQASQWNLATTKASS